MRGVKCIRFTGFTKEELPNETLRTKIKRLGLAQDLSPNSSAVRHVMFSQGKVYTNSGAHDDDDEKFLFLSK